MRAIGTRVVLGVWVCALGFALGGADVPGNGVATQSVTEASVVNSPSVPSVVMAEASADEALSRELLELKAQRQRAVEGKAGDTRVAALDEQILSLRERLGERLGDASVSGAEEVSAPPMVYPRIFVPTADDPALPQVPDDDASVDGDKQDQAGMDFRAPANVGQRAALGRLIDLNVSQQPLGAVIDNIKNQTGTNFYVNWQALQAAGIDRNTPVSLNVNAVPGNRVLHAVLAETGGDTARLEFGIYDGIVTVSTADDLTSSKYQVVTVYDVRDMFAYQDSGYPEGLLANAAQDRVNQVIDTIKAVVAPDTWRDNGGTIGSIREINGQLIVNQTGENQEAVARLLMQLRGR